MQDLSTAMPHEIQAAIAACRDPAELDRIAERAMAKWPDLAKAARRRSAAFKAHASRAGGAVRLPKPRPAAAVQVPSTMTEGAVPFNVFIVSASGISEMQLATRDMALSFAERIAAQLAEAVQVAPAPKPAARKLKLVTSRDIAPPYSWLAGNTSAKARKMALAEWAAMEPERRDWMLACDAAKRLGRPVPAKPAALAEADRADMHRRNKHHQERARFWREHEKEQQIIGNVWPCGVMRQQAILAQPRGVYSSNLAANEKLSRRVSRWMGAARRLACECTTDLEKANFAKRMERLAARRRAVIITTTTKKAA
jgi:hypothetical protein